MDGHYTPAEVAEALGVSTTTLRRVAQDYEVVFEELPRDERRVRWWPPEAVSRLHVAYQSMRGGRVSSLEQALRMISEGADLPVPPEGLSIARSDVQTQALDLLERQASALQAIQSHAEAQAQQMQELRVLVEQQAAQLVELKQEVVAARAALTPERLDDLAAQLAEIRDLDQGPLAPVLAEITAARQNMSPERMAVAIHAALPAPAPQTSAEPQAERRGGWLSDWLARMGL